MKLWSSLISTSLVVGCIALAGVALHLSQRMASVEQSKNTLERRLSESLAHTEQAQREASERVAALFEAQLRVAALSLARRDYHSTNEALEASRQLDPLLSASRRQPRNLLADYLHQLQGTSSRSYASDATELYGAKVSPDGRWLATGGDNGYLAIFGVTSGQLKKRLQGHSVAAAHTGAVVGLGYTHNAELLSAGGDGTLIRWSLPEGRILKQFDSQQRIMAIATSPTTDLVAIGNSEGQIQLRSTENGALIRQFKAHEKGISMPNGLEFSADGSLLASASADGSAAVWRSADASLQQRFKGHTQALSSASFNGDGQLLVTAGLDGRLLVWSVESGQAMRMLSRQGSALHHARFSADHRRIYAGGEDARIRVWDLIGGQAIRELTKGQQPITSLSLAPQGVYAATGNQVHHWELHEPGQWQWEVGDEPITAALSPNGEFAMVGFGDGSLRRYRLPEGEELEVVKDAHSEAVSRIAFNHDGSRLATAAGGKVQIWLDNGSLRPEYRLPDSDKPVRSLEFSADGARLAAALDDGRVLLYDSARQTLHPISAHPGGTANASFDATGERLITSASSTHMVKVWNLKNLDAIPHGVNGIPGQPRWATFHPQGDQLAVLGKDFAGAAALTPQGAAGEFHRFPGINGPLLRLAYTPDGGALVMITADAQLHLVEARQGWEIFSLQLPSLQRPGLPALVDFALRCDQGSCALLAPLTIGRLAFYRFRYQ